MDGVSIRVVTDMPIRGAIGVIVATAAIVVIEAIAARAVKVGSAWKGVAGAVVTVTVVASADVIRIDVSVQRSVATMRVALKAKVIAATDAAATGIATAVTPIGPMGIAWRPAVGPVVNPTAMKTSEIVSTQQ